MPSVLVNPDTSLPLWPVRLNVTEKSDDLSGKVKTALYQWPVHAKTKKEAFAIVKMDDTFPKDIEANNMRLTASRSKYQYPTAGTVAEASGSGLHPTILDLVESEIREGLLTGRLTHDRHGSVDELTKEALEKIQRLMSKS